ncbi:Glycosyl hydrolase family 85 [Perilla frutescens var. frutescens]|nr:Glycosyl hydrolase family 85 [Perilla frutescens var. frutescens]
MESSEESSPFDPLTPAVPISYPLKTLEELESRAYFKSFHFPFNQTAVKLPAGGDAPLPRRSRTLVCHDMAGGYTDDRFVQGGNNAEAYSIWHWYLIDVFVYFSHNLVTLPPPCWTNAAHRHGVKVLGTFILEWDEGAKIAERLLSTKTSAEMYAERLTELAVALGFDGWLINMEVVLDPVKVPILQDFVSHLTQTMHSSSPGSTVIWYDSVTVDGELNWQNQLNEKNKPFFDRCDGIFVNYTWKEDYAKLSAEVAGDRKFDVYMGIDVFGRGTYGGGQWTTNVALDVIKKGSVSAAIFAPGWVYETKQEPNFQAAQNRWWGLVEKSMGSVQSYPRVLPFYSNFDQGRGYHISVEGKQVLNTPWNNISSQSFQPFIEYPGDSIIQPIQVSVNFNEPLYSGGANITFRGTLGDNAEFTAKLFQGELLIGNSPILFTYSVNSSVNSLLSLVLEFSSPTTEKSSVFLADSRSTLPSTNSSHFMSVILPHKLNGADVESGWIMQQCSIEMRGHTLKGIHALCYKPKGGIAEVVTDNNKPALGSSDYYAVLGDIKITTLRENTTFPPSTSWLVDGELVSWNSAPNGAKRLSLKISWKLKDGDANLLIPKYYIYVTNTSPNTGVAHDFLGVAEMRSFYVSDLEVVSGTTSFKFIIQAFGHDGACQKLEDSPFYVLQVQGCESAKEKTRMQHDYGREVSLMVAESMDDSGMRFSSYHNHGSMFQKWVNNEVGVKMQRDETRGPTTTIYMLLMLSLSAIVVYIVCYL